MNLRRYKMESERFFKYVQKTSSCWLWTGGLCKGGRGQFHTTDRKCVQAHRYSWIIHKGPIPKGMCILHSCDIGGCVNPEHLFTGTMKDNTNDMLKKRRGKFFGPPQKLTPNEVKTIRSLYKPGKITLKQLAIQFNCHW